ncbi:MAG: LysM peptidoglycan-binding domain-containing protein [Candidatus Acidiferrales bacterium]
MRSKAIIWAALAFGTLFLSSCEESASPQHTKVRPPAVVPFPTADFATIELPPAENKASLLGLTDTRPRIDILVAQVQAQFNSAQKEYKAGEFEKARAEYDRTVALIQSSGFQVDSDPRLSDLLDQIGESLHSYEVNAEQESDEEDDSAQTATNPLDEFASMTLPPGDPRLATRAEQEIVRVPHDLPLTVNDSVLQYLSYFSTPKGRATVAHGIDRSGRYNAMIRRVLKEEGVPLDLMYLAQAESAFQPVAVSNKGARGIWQFMPYRGSEYNLDRTYWVDERSDPEKATRAAARHLRDLYDMFGDWYLVMAAYNSGPMNVVKGIERTGYADFWELQRRHALPKQTQNYVPIIIALALVGKDPAIYGVEVAPDKPPLMDVVKPGHSIDLRLVSDATGADVYDLRELNPELLRNVTPNDPDWELKLPQGSGAKFEGVIQQVPVDKWTSWRLHAVEQGESLGDIASHYHVTVASLESANHLESHAEVPAGFLLNIPTAPPTVKLVHYTVARGDTLEAIADRFDVTVPELKKWNKIRGSSVPRGAHLRIYAGGITSDSHPPKPKSASLSRSGASIENVSSTATGTSVQHRVRQGETLYSVAHAYNTTVENLRQANPFLSEGPLKAGDVLTIRR